MNRDHGYVPVLDPEALERLRAMGGTTLVGQIVKAFREVVEERLADVDTGLASGDRTAVRRAAHALRSSAGNVGACDVVALAARIEAHDSDDDSRVPLAVLARDLEGACDAACIRLLEVTAIHDRGERATVAQGR